MSSMGYGDSIFEIQFGAGLKATDTNGIPLTVFDGTQRVLLQSTPGTAVNYNDIKNKPSLFDGDYNNLTNRPALLQGVPGQSIVGPQGLPGADGVQGIQGLPGINGISIQGPQGIQGIQGLQGFQGYVGLTGAQGPQGNVGSTGAQGPQGVAGTNGTNGAVGAQGPAGTNGTNGAQGPAGPAPSGSVGQVVYLTSSGVAAASSNLVINTTNLTSLNPFYSNVIAGSGSSIPYSTLTGAPTLSFLPLVGGTLTGNLVATNITSISISGVGTGLSALTGANVTGTVPLSTSALTVSAAAQPAVTSVGTLTSLAVTGATTSGSFVGVGTGLSLLTGANVTGTVSLAASALTVSAAAQPAITSVGNLSSLTVTGNTSLGVLTATSHNGPASGLYALTGANVTGIVSLATTVVGASQPNITSVGTLTNLNSSGTITVSSASTSSTNATVIYNTSVSSSNSWVTLVGGSASVLPGQFAIFNSYYSSSALQISTGNFIGLGKNPLYQLDLNGTVNAGFFIGNGSAISALTGANVTGTVPLATSATTAGTVTAASQPNITSHGTLTSLTVSGATSLAGLTATSFSGPASGLSVLTGANVTGTVPLATSALTVSAAAQPAITSHGTLTALTVSGATSLAGVTATSFSGPASGLSAINAANVVGAVLTSGTATTVTANAQPNITSVGTLTSLTVTGTTTTGVLNANDPLNNDGAAHFVGCSVLSATTNIGVAIGKSRSLSNAGVLMYYHTADGSALNTLNFGIYGVNNQILTITPSSNVGIGNTAPAYPLDVTGSIRATGSCYVTGSVQAASVTASNFYGGAGSFSTATATNFSGGTHTITGGSTGTLTYLSGYPNNGSATTKDALVIAQLNGSTARLNLWGDVYAVGAQIDACANVFRWMAPGANPTVEFMRLSGPNLGIGLSPSVPFHIGGTYPSANTISVFQRFQSGSYYHNIGMGGYFTGSDGNTLTIEGVGSATSGGVSLATNGTSRLMVTSSGNIGVNNCTAPGCALSFGVAYANKVLSLFDSGATDPVATAINFFGFGINSNTLRYQVPVAQQHAWYVGNTNAMVIDQNSAVVHNAATYLQGVTFCGGIVNIRKDAGAGVEASYAANDRYGITQDTNGTMRMYTSTNYSGASIRLCGATSTTAFTDYLTITQSNGNCGIGTAAPAYKLDVNGSARFTSLKLSSQPVWNLTLATYGPATMTIVQNWTAGGVGGFMQNVTFLASTAPFPYSGIIVPISGYYSITWNVTPAYNSFLCDTSGTRLSSINQSGTNTVIISLAAGTAVCVSYGTSRTVTSTLDYGSFCGNLVS